ncbi:MAG: TIGR02757 family protein [Microscillaceae bacterium]|nr:TIGR02757 family protein [Microscillaceae bacterium]
MSGVDLQNPAQLKEFLDQAVETYNTLNFIQDDPICIPHRFSRKQDIEIMGFWTAVLAWGNRKTIIKKSEELIQVMEGQPYEFIIHHSEEDLKKFLNFKHRTFNATDALYFIHFFKHHYTTCVSLEDAFLINFKPNEPTVEKGLINFHHYFFSLEDAPERTRKHIATPARNSACKRINMFLRWMVRKDEKGVDFGIWQRISPAQLVTPCDVHVERVARKLGLISRKNTDWKTALELTENLRKLNPKDPVRYDFALFGLGVIGSL